MTGKSGRYNRQNNTITGRLNTLLWLKKGVGISAMVYGKAFKRPQHASQVKIVCNKSKYFDLYTLYVVKVLQQTASDIIDSGVLWCRELITYPISHLSQRLICRSLSSVIVFLCSQRKSVNRFIFNSDNLIFKPVTVCLW